MMFPAMLLLTSFRLLTVASSHPFVMNALVSFYLTQIGHSCDSIDSKVQYLRHRSIALEGLRNAVPSVSSQGPDPTLAASLLMLWQEKEQ